MQKNGVNVEFDDLRDQLDLLLRQTGESELNPYVLKSKAGDAVRDGKSIAGGFRHHAA